jgi:hypothetical protein
MRFGALGICKLPVTVTFIKHHFLCLWHVRSLSFGKEKEIDRREIRKGISSI